METGPQTKFVGIKEKVKYYVCTRPNTDGDRAAHCKDGNQKLMVRVSKDCDKESQYSSSLLHNFLYAIFTISLSYLETIGVTWTSPMSEREICAHPGIDSVFIQKISSLKKSFPCR